MGHSLVNVNTNKRKTRSFVYLQSAKRYYDFMVEYKYVNNPDNYIVVNNWLKNA